MKSGLVLRSCWRRLRRGQRRARSTSPTPGSAPCPAGLPAGGYFTAQNNTGREVAITGVQSDACGMLMMHQSTNKGGMSGMDMVDKVSVPAGGTVKFAPGGYHLMCEQPKMKIGAKVPVSFSLSNGTTVVVAFAVRGAAGNDCLMAYRSLSEAGPGQQRGGKYGALQSAAPCYGRRRGHGQASEQNRFSPNARGG